MKAKMKPCFRAAVKSSKLELYFYDEIGKDYYGYGVGAADVATAIKDAGDFASILVRINSPGGSVFEGSAIYNLLQSQGKPITVIIDGLAASAAFTIAMVGHDIQIGENAMMMLHNGWSLAIGDGDELRKTADLLDKINAVMMGVYAKRSGQSTDDVKAMMDAETWLSPQEAVDKGFADSIMGTSAEDAEAAKALAIQLLARSKGAHYAHVPDNFRADDVNSVEPNEETGCPCPCPECIAGDCGDCTNGDCDFEDCDHGDEAAMKAVAESAKAKAKARERQLRLAEISHYQQEAS